MAGKAKVKGNSALVRDLESNAIINADGDAYRAFKIRRHHLKQTQKTIDDLTTDKETLKSRIDALELLVQDLITKGTA